MGYLIDANVLSELRKPKRAEQVADWLRTTPSAQMYTSVLVMAELQRGSLLIRRRDPASADRLDRWIEDLWVGFGDRVLVVTREVASCWAGLMVPDPISVIDGLIAATAIVHDLTLVTRNTKDVARTAVKLLDPFGFSASGAGGVIRGGSAPL